MRKKEYTVKERYCPALGENIIVKVESTAEHRETCIYQGKDEKCSECVLGLNENSF